MYKQIIGIVALACALLIGQPAMAHHGARHMNELLESLQLTEEQKSKAKGIIKTMAKDMKEQVSQIKPYHEKISNLVQSKDMNQAKLDKVIKEKAAIIGNMMRIKVNAKHQIYLLLDAKQQAIFKQFVAKKRAEKEEKMKKMFKENDES
jgi:Spy/CpxP family protein refolding chaperone